MVQLKTFMKNQILKVVFLLFILMIDFSCEKVTTTPWVSYPTTSGVSVQAIAIDAMDNKWFCTYGDGILKFDGTNWTTYTDNGLINGASSIAIDAQGNKWLGGAVPGVLKFDGTNWTPYNTANSGLTNDTVLCIAIDSKGNKWFGTGGGGVSEFDGTNWTRYTTNSGLVNNYVTAIAIDTQGNKWLGTTDGLSKFDGINWTNYTTANGMAHNYVITIAIDEQENIWVAPAAAIAYPPYAHLGVMEFDGRNWTLYNPSADYDGIESIAIDAHGNKWFGTDNGVFKFDGTNWEHFNSANSSLKGDYYPAIAIDAEQNIWFGTMSGIGGISELRNN
jgi:ligand-binding sensor domain-containing protein